MFRQRRTISAWLIAGALAAAFGVYRVRHPRVEPRESSAPPPIEAVGSSTTARSTRHASAPVHSAEDRWQQRWRELNELSDESQRAREMESFLEELAALDPARAIDFAQADTNSELQATFLQAALRGWGRVDADAAIAWARSQSLLDPGQAIASVFHGAVRDPAVALQLAAQLSEDDPERARDYGSYLVSAFARAGDFTNAAAFALNGDPEVRTDWLNAAFSRWAEDQPRAALEHLAQWSDPENKRIAFDATVSRWARRSAQDVAEYSLTLPEGHERTLALSVALRTWAADDPAVAAEWMNRLEPSAALDLGVAMLASQPDAAPQPQIAIGWAESIVDPSLRSRVLASVLNEWAAIDPAAARYYAETSLAISLSERATVFSAFEPGFKPISLLP